MEFFFLTQNVYVEILIFISLIITVIVIWWMRFFSWIKRIYEILNSSRRARFALAESKKQEALLQENILHQPLSDEVTLKNDIEKEINEEEGDSDRDKTVTPTNISDSDVVFLQKLDTSNVEKIANIVSSVRTLMARGMIIEAKALIIEWLSFEKDHRDLNFLLGTIYEQDWQYEKAEYIYKDMAELHPSDLEILEKLANVLIVEKKYHIASEIYKKIHSSTGNTETTLYMLAHISNTLEDHHSTLTYAKQYVLQWPKNPEIISLLANVQVILGHRRDAIETYKHLKNLTPYSSEISEILQKLLIEEELANNFAGKEM